MDHKNDIDKFFKKKLENREFELKDSFLADLENKLDAQKSGRKRRGFLYFGLAALIVVSVLTYYFVNSEGSESSQLVQSNIEEKIIEDEIIDNTSEEETSYDDIVSGIDVEDNSNESLNEDNTGLSEEKYMVQDVNSSNSAKTEDDIVFNELNEEELIASNSDNDIDSESGQDNELNSRLSNNEVAVSSSSVNQDDVNVAPNNAEALKSNQNDSNNTTNESNSNTIGSEVENEVTQEISDQENSADTQETEDNESVVNSEELNDKEVVSDQQEDSNVSDNSTETLLPEESNTNTESDSIQETVEELDDNVLIVSDTSETTVQDSLVRPAEDEIAELISDTSQNSNLEDSVKTITVKNNPEPVSENWKRWRVSLGVGPSWVSKKIIDGSGESYLKKRNSEEEKILNLSYSIGLDYFLKNSVSLSTGLNTVTYGEDANYTSVNILESIDTNYISSYIYDPILDSNMVVIDTIVTPVYSDTTLYDTITGDYSFKNRYTYAHIPFMLGYRYDMGIGGSKIGMHFKLGGSYGFLLKGKGQYVNTTLDGLETAELKSNVWNLNASVELSYYLKNLILFVEPKYQLNRSPLFYNTGLNQQYSSFGVNFGVALEF